MVPPPIMASPQGQDPPATPPDAPDAPALSGKEPPVLSVEDARNILLQETPSARTPLSLWALARALQREGQAAEAAIWYHRALHQLGRTPSPLNAAQGILIEEALQSALRVELPDLARNALRRLRLEQGDPPPAAIRRFRCWAPFRSPHPASLLLYQTSEGLSEEALCGLAAARRLQKQGCQILVVAPTDLQAATTALLGPEAPLVPNSPDLHNRLDKLPASTLRAPLRRFALAWATLSLQSIPMSPLGRSPRPAHGPWFLALPPHGHPADPPTSPWETLRQHSSLTPLPMPEPHAPSVGPPVAGEDEARSTETQVHQLSSAIGHAAGVVGSSGLAPLIAAIKGIPVVILRASNSAWWWGNRPNGSPWFPSARIMELTSDHAAADALRLRGQLPPPGGTDVTIDDTTLRRNWSRWAGHDLCRARQWIAPGGGLVQASELTKGTHNRLLHLQGPQANVVLRMGDWPVTRHHFFVDEFHNMTLAAEAGLAPPLIHGDDLDGMMVLPFLSGPVLRKVDLRSAEIATMVAAHYRALHHLSGFRGGYDIFQRVHRRRQALDDSHFPLYATQASWHHAMDEIASLLTAQQPPSCACHNDAVPENLIRHENGILMIDWQISGMGDPHWDIGSLVGKITLQQAQKDAFYQAYFGHADHPGRSRAALYEAFCVYHNLLRAIHDGWQTPGKTGWKSRYRRWSRMLETIGEAGDLPYHLHRARDGEAVVPPW